MPFVPVTQRDQVFTTGPNAEVRIGRSSTTTKEWDIKDYKVTKRWANQEKTGSMSQGFEDHEKGVIGHTISITFINEVEDPNTLYEDNNVWYLDARGNGHADFQGYMILDSYENGYVVNADHTITVSAKSCTRKEAGTAVLPVWTPYSP